MDVSACARQIVDIRCFAFIERSQMDGCKVIENAVDRKRGRERLLRERPVKSTRRVYGPGEKFAVENRARTGARRRLVRISRRFLPAGPTGRR